MMFDLPMRLFVAYGLIGLMLLGAVALAWWCGRNTHRSRDARSRARLAKHYRRRDEASAAADS